MMMQPTALRASSAGGVVSLTAADMKCCHVPTSVGKSRSTDGGGKWSGCRAQWFRGSGSSVESLTAQ